MKEGAAKYLHVLAFQCPRCGMPMVEWVTSPQRNLEATDASAFTPKCSCGWSGRQLGAQAREHLVLPWPESNQTLSQETSKQDEGERV
jgi:hypothetical protein